MVATMRKLFAGLLIFSMLLATNFATVYANESVIPLDNLAITSAAQETIGSETTYLEPRIGLKNQRKTYPIFHDSHPDGICALIAAAVKANSFVDTETFENGELPKLRNLTRYNISKSYFDNYSVEFTEERCNGVENQQSYEVDYYLISKKGLIIDKYIRKTCGNKFPKSYKIITCKKR